MERYSSYLLNCLCHSKGRPWSGPILWQDRQESDCLLRLTTQIITISACIHDHSGHHDTSTITVCTQSKGLCISYAKPTPDYHICDSSSKLTVLWWGRLYCTEHWRLPPLLEYWQHSSDFISGAWMVPHHCWHIFRLQNCCSNLLWQHHSVLWN